MARAVRMASAGVASAVVVMPAQSASWSWTPRAAAGADYSDNLQLSNANTLEATGGRVDIAANLLRTSDWLKWSIDPRVVLVRYNRYSAYDRDDGYLDTTLTHSTEKGDASLSASWLRDSTITSEAGSTGLTQSNRKHESSVAAVSQSWQATERYYATTQLSWSANRYMDAAGTGLVNYNYAAGQLQTGYLLTPQSKLSLMLAAGRLLVPTESSFNKTSLSAQLSIAGQLTETTSAALMVGPSKVSSGGSSDNGLVYDLSLARRGLLSTFKLGLTQDVTATGRGVLSRQQRLSFNATRAFSERWSAGINAVKVHNEDALPASGFTFYKVNYLDSGFNLNWQMAPQWSLAFSAGYSQQRAGSDSADLALGHHGSLYVQWSGLTRSIF